LKNLIFSSWIESTPIDDIKEEVDAEVRGLADHNSKQKQKNTMKKIKAKNSGP
jgi:hypothetical protein